MRTPWPRGRVFARGIVLLLCANGCVTTLAARQNRALAFRTMVADSRTVVSAEWAPWPDLPLDEALERVRPDVLRRSYLNRDVAVYVDRMPSSFGELHALTARQVLTVHFLTLPEAQAEYGSMVMQPVLDVTLSRVQS